jgi:hypothetical protein
LSGVTGTVAVLAGAEAGADCATDTAAIMQVERKAVAIAPAFVRVFMAD